MAATNIIEVTAATVIRVFNITDILPVSLWNYVFFIFINTSSYSKDQ